MPDSIYPANLPPGYPAYLGYVDGNWPTLPELKVLFPAAHLIGLTVTGNTLNADGIDVELQNPNAVEGVAWVGRKLAQAPASRPVIYASTLGDPGYGMHEVINELIAQGISLNAVRLLSAHYGTGEHICGPATCNLISLAMDGTQWTDQAPGAGGSKVDMSVVHDTFFETPSPPKAETMKLPPAPGDWGPTTSQYIDYQGTLYVVGPNGGNAIYMTKSTDGGAHWSTPKQL